MPARRIKVDVFDAEGSKLTISFEGRITREKVLQLLDLTEILGGIPVSNVDDEKSASMMSKFERMQLLLRKDFPVGWFSSQMIQSAYEKLFNEPTQISTVSTYLARLSERGLLIRSGSPANRRYRLKRDLLIRKEM
jgi:DNA-binding transcriptional ArsR family regulator